jgi:MFS family permease
MAEILNPLLYNVGAQNDSDKTDDLHQKRSILGTYVQVIAAIASLNSASIGYAIGSNTGLAHSFQRSDSNIVYMTDLQLELFFGAATFTAIFGALGMFLISDNFGRRMTFIASQVAMLLGSALMLLTNDYSVLMVGKAFTGFSIGIGLSVDPMYVSHPSDANFITLDRIVSFP